MCSATKTCGVHKTSVNTERWLALCSNSADAIHVNCYASTYMCVPVKITIDYGNSNYYCECKGSTYFPELIQTLTNLLILRMRYQREREWRESFPYQKITRWGDDAAQAHAARAVTK